MARSRLVIALALAVACTALTGAAFAGPPDDPGKSENAPGQEKKAEAPAPAPAATPPASGTAGKPASPGKSGSAPGKTKTGGPTVAQQGEGHIKTAHEKVVLCHSTGSATNPWVVINVSVNALKSGHDQLGTREAVMAPSARQPGRKTADVHGGRFDTILGDPDTLGNVSKAELEARCAQFAAPPPPPEEEAVGAAVTLAVTPPPEGEVAGVEAVVTKPGKRVGQVERPARGGVLGALGAVAGEELPFTGLPLWIAALIGFGLVGAGFGARKAMR